MDQLEDEWTMGHNPFFREGVAPYDADFVHVLNLGALNSSSTVA